MAGGMAVYLHADRIAARLRSTVPTMKIRAAQEVGFFLDHGALSKKPQDSFTYHAKVMYNMQNMSGSGGLSRSCLAANPVAPWLCFLAPHIMATSIRTLMFELHSRYDEWQLHNILQAPCVPSRPWYNATKCSMQEASAILDYGSSLTYSSRLSRLRSSPLEASTAASLRRACVTDVFGPGCSSGRSMRSPHSAHGTTTSQRLETHRCISTAGVRTAVAL